MVPVRPGRLRRAIALTLLASLVPGLVAPVLAARGHGASGIYSEWLAERMADGMDQRVSASIVRLEGDRFVSLGAYLDALVSDLVGDHGLSATALMLGEDHAPTTDDLVARLLDGLHSLAPGELPAATLVVGPDGRCLPLVRSAGAVDFCAGTRYDREDRSTNPDRFDLPPFPICRPATGGAQPLGP